MFAQFIWSSFGGQKPELESAEEHATDGVENGFRFTDCGCGKLYYVVQI